MVAFVLVLGLGCGAGDDAKDTGSGAETGSDTDTSADTGADTNTDTSTDTSTDTGADPTGLFLSATGTVGGEPATFACDEESPGYAFYATQTTDGSGTWLLGGACTGTEEGDGYSVNIGVRVSGPASSSTCVANTWGIQVVDVGTGAFYNCALDGTTAFDLAIDELTEEGDGAVIWGGTFRVAGDGAYLDADLTGSFRFSSAR